MRKTVIFYKNISDFIEIDLLMIGKIIIYKISVAVKIEWAVYYFKGFYF